VAEWSKAPDSSSGPRKRAWVQIPLLTISSLFFSYFFKLNHNTLIQLAFAYTFFSSISNSEFISFLT
ncbi:hypothetical protein LINPERPRIM_LOCUS12002, partial [Linum perenne]